MPGCVRSATSWCPRLGSSPACTTTTVRCRTSPPTAYAAACRPRCRPAIHPTEAHPAAFEQLHRVGLDELELHRRNVLPHLANLDLASYDKDYAAAAERAAARTGHLARWPAAVDAALAALDRLRAPVAGALTAEVIAYTRAPLGAAHRRRVSGGAVAGIPALGDGQAHPGRTGGAGRAVVLLRHPARPVLAGGGAGAVSYTHLRAHETDSYLVCRLL